MPDLIYLLRHPIQEARIARHQRKHKGGVPFYRSRRRWRAQFARFEIMQGVARWLIAPWFVAAQDDSLAYVEGRDDLVGENEDAYIYARDYSTAEWWVPFDLFRKGHLSAALRTRREKRANMLHLEG